METEYKNGAPLQTTTEKKEAIPEKLSEHKNLSDFRNPKVGDQPCMSLLYAISDAKLPRPTHPVKAPVQTTDFYQVPEEDREFYNAAMRAIVKDFLKCLIRDDPTISNDGARTLLHAINVIERSSA